MKVFINTVFSKLGLKEKNNNKENLTTTNGDNDNNIPIINEIKHIDKIKESDLIADYICEDVKNRIIQYCNENNIKEHEIKKHEFILNQFRYVERLILRDMQEVDLKKIIN